MRGLLILVASVAIGFGSGCAGNARYVHKAGDEGIIAVGDRTDSWPSYNMTNAKKMIESHVGPYYDIVEEKEVVTGNVTHNQQHTNRDTTTNPFVPFLQAEQQQTTTTTTSVPVKEWQIHYRKRVGTQVGTGFGGPGPFGGIQQTGAQQPTQQQQMQSNIVPAGGPQFEVPSVHPSGAAATPPRSVSPAALSQRSGSESRQPTVTITGN